jgi:hypothetical protein
MPWKHEWVPAQLAFTVTQIQPETPERKKAVWPYNIYHAYKDNNWGERLAYWYTLHDGFNSDGTHCMDPTLWRFEFDIRDLPNFDDNLNHKDILQIAINQNLCTINNDILHIKGRTT